MSQPTAIVVGVGAPKGLGAALCRRTSKEGLHTLVAGRTQERIEGVAEELGKAGGAATAVPTDTTLEADVVQLFDAAEKIGGEPPELVIYNAGNNAPLATLDMGADFFEDVWRVCCLGGFLVGREAMRRMPARGSGSLLFTGATASIRGRPPFAAFASAKAALRALAQAFAREFGPQGIHVGHVVVDGVINGEQIWGRFPQFAEQLGDDGMLDVDDMADAFWMLHRQPRSAWTHEIDLRPFKEKF